MHRIDLTHGAVLEKGCVYVVPLMEALALPPGITAVANAKSSTGRLDLLTRIITDGGTEFDRIPEGYAGPLYAEICPRSFSVLVRPGMRLNQIRFRDGQAVLTDAELAALHAETPLVDGDARHRRTGSASRSTCGPRRAASSATARSRTPASSTSTGSGTTRRPTSGKSCTRPTAASSSTPAPSTSSSAARR